MKLGFFKTEMASKSLNDAQLKELIKELILEHRMHYTMLRTPILMNINKKKSL